MSSLVRKRYHERMVLDVMEAQDSKQDFARDVLEGLSASPKSIPPKYFYDEQGSRLFEQITELEEYYPTRTEAAILARYGEEMISSLEGPVTMVELGSGSSTKTRLLLDILSGKQERVDYVPIDISPAVVTEFGEQLLLDYPSLHIRGLICDYLKALGELREEQRTRKLFLFLGSSLGNSSPAQGAVLLRGVRETMGEGDGLLLGVDMKKDPQLLEKAYNDEKGVTAAFNLNLLSRINRELGGQFDPRRFLHKAFYNRREGRVEMHLESLVPQIVPVSELGCGFSLRQGETIHTENSYKYDQDILEELLAECGMNLLRQWTDDQGWFSVTLAVPA